ncbi:MAG: ScyD/ScyE family protein, partial [Chloroflexota bacterium]|nr:ScyD/ScyE family protein [Chloroflexota bacterium]
MQKNIQLAVSSLTMVALLATALFFLAPGHVANADSPAGSGLWSWARQVAATAPTVGGGEHEVVASGLVNPRHLTFGPDGSLYIAEAGTGGDECVQVDPEYPDFVVCFGQTGAITRVSLDDGTQERVVSDLPSVGDEFGFALGPHDVSFDEEGNLFSVVGLFFDPAAREELCPLDPELCSAYATLVSISETGEWEVIADLGAFEASQNPDDNIVETNPYALLTDADGHVVVDASGNDLLRVDSEGDISTLAVFPLRTFPNPFPPPDEVDMHPVPTSVEMGPDGAYYVGELTGFPFPQGEANIYRIEPGDAPDKDPEILATGFTMITD